ncbi:hypothetical protein ACH3XW_39450 [Acanthocheilonema viteae]|uniref:Uncharacterized protein n=1 Tax=Acanthocheilonema viteae TaxID=6277 RepID=A0A498SPS0_ACAVI|nr:unnamed protein product [Acanthocheilonema viteae]
MHGTGVGEYGDSGDDISDTKSDLSESDEDRYSGYQTLPTSDSSFEIASAGHDRTSSVVQNDFEKILSSENRNSGLGFNIAKSIELTEDKIERIKKTMSAFTLPAPSWAKGIDSDNELKKLLEKLKSK